MVSHFLGVTVKGFLFRDEEPAGVSSFFFYLEIQPQSHQI